MAKRAFDIFFSILGIIMFSPLFLFITLIISAGSTGGILFKQTRVGKNNKDFTLYKFRTMYPGANKDSLITIGNNDQRITREGRFLRKYKLDELPQLFNILNGTMSFVGPRPEVRKYVDLYDDDQMVVLKVKPGLTDYASLEYFSEAELLAKKKNPEDYYVNEIMPGKLKLNILYIKNHTLFTDVGIIIKTLIKIFQSG